MTEKSVAAAASSTRSLTPLVVLLWRLGLGALVGQFWMLITARDSEPFAAEYFFVNGKKYAVADWYRGPGAVTIQTAYGVERVNIRPVTDSDELARVTATLAHNRPGYAQRAFSYDGARADRPLVSFEPTDALTPEPLHADLIWVLPLALATILLWRALRR